jgi:hypothetical protein
MLQPLIIHYVSRKLVQPDTEPKPEAMVHAFRIAVSRQHQMKLQFFTVRSSSASGFIHLPEPLFFARQTSRAFLCGMSILQEHQF